MKLLVKRDPLVMKAIDGKVVLDSDVPEFLRKPYVARKEYVTSLKERSEQDDLLVVDGRDLTPEEEGFFDENHKNHVRIFKSSRVDDDFKNLARKSLRKRMDISIPAIWSGYRSVLVRDHESDRLFRIKGVSLDPTNPQITSFEDGVFWINGGQKAKNAECERRMSDRFNGYLENEGIEPVMRSKGVWKYPKKVKGQQPVASVVEVKGDTRLDELMIILENLSIGKREIRFRKEVEIQGRKGFEIESYPLNNSGNKFANEAIKLYGDIGYTIGRLKRLMDKSGQTWSCDTSRSNAHIGNIVLYNGTDKLKVGFVDFDASCGEETDNLDPSEIKEINQREYQTIIESILSGPISPRQMLGKPFSSSNIAIDQDLRYVMIRGFEKGYASSRREYSNEVSLGLLQSVFTLLRESGKFTVRPAPFRSPIGIFDPVPYGIQTIGYGDKKDKEFSLESIIGNNFKYQNSLLKGMKYMDDDYIGGYLGQSKKDQDDDYLGSYIRRAQNI